MCKCYCELSETTRFWKVFNLVRFGEDLRRVLGCGKFYEITIKFHKFYKIICEYLRTSVSILIIPIMLGVLGKG